MFYAISFLQLYLGYILILKVNIQYAYMQLNEASLEFRNLIFKS